MTARRKGEQKPEAANLVLKCGLIGAGLLGLVITLLGVVLAKPFMLLAGAETGYLSYAITYFQIISCGFLFQAINLVINAAQRGCGNTKITMQTNVIANVTNVVFNYLLIGGNFGFPALGVSGAAIATLLGTIMGCLVAVITLFYRKGYLNIYKAWKEKVTSVSFYPLMHVGSSALVEQIFLRVGFILFAILVARLGTTAYATHLICMTYFNISYSFGEGISVAASTLVGQYLGANKVELAKMYGKLGQRIAFVVSTAICIIFIIGRSQFIQLFSDDIAVIQIGGNILIIAAFITHIQTSQLVFNGCLRGAGDSKFVALVALGSVAIVRPILTFLLCFGLGFGVYGAWMAILIDQSFRLIFAFKRFYSGKWSLIKL